MFEGEGRFDDPLRPDGIGVVLLKMLNDRYVPVEVGMELIDKDREGAISNQLSATSATLSLAGLASGSSLHVVLVADRSAESLFFRSPLATDHCFSSPLLEGRSMSGRRRWGRSTGIRPRVIRTPC